GYLNALRTSTVAANLRNHLSCLARTPERQTSRFHLVPRGLRASSEGRRGGGRCRGRRRAPSARRGVLDAPQAWPGTTHSGPYHHHPRAGCRFGDTRHRLSRTLRVEAQLATTCRNGREPLTRRPLSRLRESGCADRGYLGGDHERMLVETMDQAFDVIEHLV